MSKKTDKKKAVKSATEKKQRANAKLYPFRFTGTTGEYFRIWIVNVLLTVISLGSYYSWAKTRTKNYYYSNTVLASSSFKYDAQPMMLLKGWAIVAVLCLFAWILFNLTEKNAFLVAAVGIFLAPWMLLQSLLFRAKHSRYRDIPLRMKPDYAEAVRLGMLLSILVLPVLAASPFILSEPEFGTRLLYSFYVELPIVIFAGPYVLYYYKKFVIENLRFGETSFSFSASLRDFYKFALGYAAIGALGTSPLLLYNFLFADTLAVTSMDLVEIAKGLSLMLLAILSWIYAIAGFHTRVTNLIYNSIALGENGFEANLKVKDIFGIYLSNLFAIIISGGLLIPWAKIRMALYRAKKIELAVIEDLDYFIAVNRTPETAAGKSAPAATMALEFGL